jgi:hypothetical protein
MVSRSFRFPMLSAFDLPDNVSSCGRRDVTTVPNQALTLLNNGTIREQASAFAERLVRESRGDPSTLARLAWRYAYGREISREELRRAVEFLAGSDDSSFGARGEPDAKAVEALCLALFNTNEFIYIP